MGVVLAFALSLHGQPQPRLGVDKVKHFFASAFVQSVSYSALRLVNVEHDEALLSAGAITVTLGIAKEVRDARFDFGDLVADLAGGAAAAALLEQSRR